MNNIEKIEQQSKEIIKLLERLMLSYPIISMNNEADISTDALALREVLKDHDNGLFKNVKTKKENNDIVYYVESENIQLDFQCRSHHVQWFTLSKDDTHFTYNEKSFHIFSKLFNKEKELLPLLEKVKEKLNNTQHYMKMMCLFTEGYQQDFHNESKVTNYVEQLVKYIPYPERLCLTVMGYLPNDTKKIMIKPILASIEHTVDYEKELNALYDNKIMRYLDQVAQRKCNEYNKLFSYRGDREVRERKVKDYGYASSYKRTIGDNIELLDEIIKKHNLFYNLKKDVEKNEQETKPKMKI